MLEPIDDAPRLVHVGHGSLVDTQDLASFGGGLLHRCTFGGISITTESLKTSKKTIFQVFSHHCDDADDDDDDAAAAAAADDDDDEQR